MTNSTLEAVLRRDRLVVAGAVGVIVALAWGYVLWLAADTGMGGMDMTGFRMIPAGMGIMAPANAPWRAIEFAFVFAMWAVMMVGMMAPSAAPMILMYARVGRQGNAAGKPLAATGWFASGYFLTWIGFSLAATLVQWVVERAALLDSRMASASNMFGGIVLIAAGAYQWTPLKDVCLAQCQSPFQFLMRHGGFRGDLLGCLLLGLRHGWSDERSLDRAPGAACPSGESYSIRPEGRARRRRCLYRRGCLDVVFFTAVMSRLLFHVNV
jgi:predicted metal-binding membrane protein